MTDIAKQRIVIFSDVDGQHEDNLATAFNDYQVDVSRVSLMDCELSFSNSSTGIKLPGFTDELPLAAFVRGIPTGSFEEVTLRLDILHALQESGVIVYNTGRAIERTVDKGMTSFLLNRASVATPPTWVCESEIQVRKIVTDEIKQGHKVVLKPLFGNCGRGLQLLDTPDLLPDKESVSGVYYLQRFVASSDSKGRDWRVLVIADHAIAAMERISDHWITNRARGGKCLPALVTPEIRELAVSACRAIGMNYAGVDIIRDTQGKYQVLEVNSVPAWRGLQTVTDSNISSLLAADLMHLCDNKDLEKPYLNSIS